MKNFQRTAALLILLALPWATGCFTIAGGLVGGTVGGGAGLVGGVCTGHPVEGVAVGAAGGAVIGGAAGAVVDTVITAPLRIPSAIADAVKPKPGLSVDEVIRMHESGVATDMIVLQIQTEGMKDQPTSQELIRLAQKNVAQEIVIAMQSNLTSKKDRTVITVPATQPYGPQQLQDQPQANRAQPFAFPELPSNQPDMTPAITGGAFGPPHEGVPGFTPGTINGFTPTNAEGGRWNLDDVPRTPGGARIQPHPQGVSMPAPNVVPAPQAIRQAYETAPPPPPTDNPYYETTDASPGAVDYESIWHR